MPARKRPLGTPPVGVPRDASATSTPDPTLDKLDSMTSQSQHSLDRAANATYERQETDRAPGWSSGDMGTLSKGLSSDHSPENMQVLDNLAHVDEKALATRRARDAYLANRRPLGDGYSHTEPVPMDRGAPTPGGVPETFEPDQDDTGFQNRMAQADRNVAERAKPHPPLPGMAPRDATSAQPRGGRPQAPVTGRPGNVDLAQPGTPAELMNQMGHAQPDARYPGGDGVRHDDGDADDPHGINAAIDEGAAHMKLAMARRSARVGGRPTPPPP